MSSDLKDTIIFPQNSITSGIKTISPENFSKKSDKNVLRVELRHTFFAFRKWKNDKMADMNI